MTVELEMKDAYPSVNGIPNGVHNGVEKKDLFRTPKLKELAGKQYVAGATILAEQVAYTLSTSIFEYKDGLPDEPSVVAQWHQAGEENPSNHVPNIEQLETRTAAGTFILGHSSKTSKTATSDPASFFAASATVGEMHAVLQQLARHYLDFSPVVGHIAAVDADSSANFVCDYVTPLRTAREAGLAAIISKSSDELQYISILATLFGTVLPTLHVYDGIRLARALTEVPNVMPAVTVKPIFDSVRRSIPATNKPDPLPQLTNLLTSFNQALNTKFSFFEYTGHQAAESVLVVLGSAEASLANAVANVLAHQGVAVGVINVRIYQPFSDPEFLVSLPRSTKHIAVLGQIDSLDSHSILYEDVLAAVATTQETVQLTDVQYRKDQTWTAENFAWIFQQLVARSDDISLTPPETTVPTFNDYSKKYVFWDLDDSISSVTARKVLDHFAEDPSLTVSFNETYDNFRQAGTLYSEVRTGKAGSRLPFTQIDFADVVVLNDISIANSFDILRQLAPAGKLLLKTTIKPEQFDKKIPLSLRNALFARKDDIEAYFINPKDAGQVGEGDVAESIVMEGAFLKVIGSPENIADFSEAESPDSSTLQGLQKIKENVDASLQRLEIPESWADLSETESPVLPVVPRGNAYTPNPERQVQEPGATIGTWHDAAKALLFKESYDSQTALRPELPIKNWVVRVQENKRLTPLTYDRNIFHIEFDLTGTDLKYTIGEALGVHAHNDEVQVECFLKWYGLEGDAVVSVPAKEVPGYVETKTIRQLFVQTLDVFGKPPKKFYEGLSVFATDEKEKTRLLALGGSEGAVEFKRRSEVETLTFADILEEFPSAKPELADLVKLIPAIKRREYSIASSQRVHPTGVHLLVVEVNWRDDRSRDRYGQATRYLSQLPVGAKVTVSVKSSAMKLPADDSTPIIMAGLGTGLAPFRAFVQERALARSMGKEIGPVLLYMGSRHQREEYLYCPWWDFLTLGTVRNGRLIGIRGLSPFLDWPFREISQRKFISRISCVATCRKSWMRLSARRAVSTFADRYAPLFEWRANG